MDNALRIFCKEFNIEVFSLYPVWDRYENFIKGEEYIDSIPTNCIIHDTYFKKVYGDGIELKQTEAKEDPGVHIKHYIKNRIIEDITPEIAQELNKINNSLEGKLVPVLEEFSRQLNLHIKVQENTLEVQRETKETMKDIRDFITKKPPKKSIKKVYIKRKKYGLTDEELEILREP